MTEFAYNNIKNANTSHTPFQLSWKDYPRVLFKNDVNPYSKSRLAEKLTQELRDLMCIYQQNLLHAQK